MSALEWILIYSTVPITFHVITNTDSISYVERIFGKVNATANCHFDYEIITLASLMDLTATNICPKMTVKKTWIPNLNIPTSGEETLSSQPKNILDRFFLSYSSAHSRILPLAECQDGRCSI